MGASAIVVGLLVTFQAVTLDTLFTVGSINGPVETSFGRVTDVALGAEDMLFVIDATDPHVRVFDRNGQPAALFGERGQGPGELTRPRTAEWLDSTLVVVHNGAVSEFGPDGRFVDSWRPRVYGILSTAMRLGDAAYLAFKEGTARTSGMDPLQELFISTESGTQRLAEGVSGTVFLKDRSGAAGAMGAGLCGALSVTYVGHGAFVVGNGERGTITLYDGADAVSTLAVAPAAGPIPDEVEDRIMDLVSQTSFGRSPSTRVTLPTYFSTVCHVHAESADRAWFRRNGYRDDPEEWQAVDLETGELTASFRLEPGMRVESIRAGRVAGVWQDDLGVSYVTVFALPEG